MYVMGRTVRPMNGRRDNMRIAEQLERVAAERHLPRVAARREGRHGWAWRYAAVTVDIAMLGLATLVQLALSAGVDSIPFPPVPWLLVYLALVLVSFYVHGLYTPRLRRQLLDDLKAVISWTAIAAMAVLTLRAIVSDASAAASETVGQWLIVAAFVGAGRVGLAYAWRQAWKHGEWLRPTLIVGAGQVGHLIARRLLDHPESGLVPVGFLDKEPLADDERTGLPTLGASWDLDRVVHEHNVQHVIVTFSTAPHQVLLRLVQRCDELDVRVSLVPRLFEKVTERLTVEHFGGLPLLTIQTIDPRGWQFELKYAADRALAAFGLVVLSPLLALTAAAIRLTMGSPVFFRQTRVGLDGREFELVKFRSMRVAPADAIDAPEEGDERSRLTPVGAFVRATSLDELPQLLNVVRGDMSLIGPRPERPEYCEIFEDYVYRYGDRHRVKSGITGWAQVHGIGRGADRFSKETLSDRVEWDNFYIENWSFWLDFKIVLMTFAAVLSFRQS
jgi:exopolysaccharide biosynthesis polyprenyl glycosylphosphotransferase